MVEVVWGFFVDLNVEVLEKFIGIEVELFNFILVVDGVIMVVLLEEGNVFIGISELKIRFIGGDIEIFLNVFL